MNFTVNWVNIRRQTILMRALHEEVSAIKGKDKHSWCFVSNYLFGLSRQFLMQVPFLCPVFHGLSQFFHGSFP